MKPIMVRIFCRTILFSVVVLTAAFVNGFGSGCVKALCTGMLSTRAYSIESLVLRGAWAARRAKSEESFPLAEAHKGMHFTFESRSMAIVQVPILH